MTDSNIVLHQLTVEFGLLREHHYSKFEYRKLLGTDGIFMAFRLRATLAPVRKSNLILGQTT